MVTTRKRFASCFPIRARKTSQLELNPFTPLRRIRNFDCSAPFRAGRPLYIDLKIPVNALRKIFLARFPPETFPTVGMWPEERAL
jgi:hypothetical protein